MLAPAGMFHHLAARGSGSAARGGAYWSRIHQGAAAGVARNTGADESAGFICWRGQDHGQFGELGVDLLSPALNFRIPVSREMVLARVL
jgi:hypothetical protein